MRTFALAATAALTSAFVNVDMIEQSLKGNYESMTITENGQSKTLYVAHPDWYSGVSDNGVNLPEGARSYFFETPNFDSESHYKPNLLGGSVEYDIDMSSVSCGCIAAFYLVKLPAHDSNGQAQQTDGFWYCDAQAVGGVLCPEFDIMEANQYAFQTTSHSCTYAGNGHYSDCDHDGHAINNSVDDFNHQGKNSYGPGNWFTIDTTQPYHFKIDFFNTGDQFTGYQVTMTQDGKSIDVSSYDESLTWMSYDIIDMAFAMSNWSGDASWLWKDSCGGGCSDPTIVFKNIAITTGSSSVQEAPNGDSLVFTQVSGQDKWLLDTSQTHSDPAYPVKGTTAKFIVAGTWFMPETLVDVEFKVLMNGTPLADLPEADAESVMPGQAWSKEFDFPIPGFAPSGEYDVTVAARDADKTHLWEVNTTFTL